MNKFRKYAKWIDSAKKTLKKATRNALVEFYSDPSWYGAFNKKLDYDRAGFDLLMAQQLEPTCLGGPKKTLEWIEENKEGLLEQKITYLTEKELGSLKEYEIEIKIDEIIHFN